MGVEKIRAVGLLSGGLDSTLAARLMREQGIEVEGLHLAGPFGCDTPVEEVARELQIRLTIREKGPEYIGLVKAPRFGYGKNMNPCIDCRIFMFHRARTFMDEVGASFIFTGEVVGQRPMSQMRESLRKIDKESGLEGLVLRPLSAAVLLPTIPEEKGWVDRGKLLDISGRSRRTQLALAEEFGLESFASPGGGCLLTDPEFSRKLEDLFAHVPDPSMEEARLLRYGRHLRVGPETKVVVGRNAEENAALEKLAGPGRLPCRPANFIGPVALLCGSRTEEAMEITGRLLVRYTKGLPPQPEVEWEEAGVREIRPVGGVISEEECAALRI